jgi:DNA-binding IclR family transcriptional regulator
MTTKPAGASMKTIDKAMTLLGFFLPDTPEWRLSDLARAAGMDKATAMRVLNSLAAGGLVEQHPETRKYRLGTAVLRLARIREACFPVVEVLQPVLEELMEETGETTHACMNAGSSMTTIAIAEPSRSTRVFVDPAQALPVHATASGLAYLAFEAGETADDLLARGDLRAFVANTPVDTGILKQQLADIRAAGVAVSDRTLEDDVTGVAAPIFDWHGNVQATIAAACVASRLDDDRLQAITRAVRDAAVRATRAMGGET